MNFLEKIKNGEQKKIIENSVIFLMLFVIIIIVMNTLNVPEEKVTKARRFVSLNPSSLVRLT